MGEESAVKVETNAFLLCPVDPVIKVFWLKCIKIALLIRYRIDGVQLNPMLAGNQA